jgi:hypothetical protein
MVAPSTYPYYQYIKTPQQLGMSGQGSLHALGNDIDGLLAYTEVLVSGHSKASATGRPLGNQFFLDTGTKCTDSSGNQQERYSYYNFIPNGSIPFISTGLGGTDITSFEGIIPGILQDMNVFDPYAMLNAMTAPTDPSCSLVTLNVVDNSNNITRESNYVANVDLSTMDPCLFPDRKNPINGNKCLQGFTPSMDSEQSLPLPQDTLTQIFYAAICVLVLYIIYRMMLK